MFCHGSLLVGTKTAITSYFLIELTAFGLLLLFSEAFFWKNPATLAENLGLCSSQSNGIALRTHVGRRAFNAFRMDGRCSPLPSRPYGTRFRSRRGFWDRL
jgi:hypothetical protein